MTETRLREALELLQAELDDATEVDDEQRQLLADAAEDLQRVLAARHDDAPSGLADRLERAAVDFESEHPSIARTLNEIVAALARMGI